MALSEDQYPCTYPLTGRMRPPQIGAKSLGRVKEMQPMDKNKPVWERDPLAVLGVGAAVVAFLVWAWPEFPQPAFSRYHFVWFESERLPAILAFLALSHFLLLLRRR